MNTYKVQVYANIIGFHESIIEAPTREEAERTALKEAKVLGTHGFDLEEIESLAVNETVEISL